MKQISNQFRRLQLILCNRTGPKFYRFGKELSLSAERKKKDRHFRRRFRTMSGCTDWSKLETFADNKINVTQNLKLMFRRLENCGKRRKCWLPAFSPFQKASLPG